MIRESTSSERRDQLRKHRLVYHFLRMKNRRSKCQLKVESEGGWKLEAWLLCPAMAPKADSVEGTVLNFITEQNRPLNAQMVADALQQHGIKKTSVQKVMDTLAATGKITFKDYGKQRVYLASQTQFEIPDIDELEAMKKKNKQLQVDVAAARSHVSELETEVRSLESNLTLDQIKEKTKTLNSEVYARDYAKVSAKMNIRAMESKLHGLREGGVLVTPKERLEVQGAYDQKLGLWRKRRKTYQELWGMVTESMTENLKDLKEELGIETDEDICCNIADYNNLGIKKPKKVV